MGNQLIRHALRRFGVSDQGGCRDPEGAVARRSRPRLVDALDELVEGSHDQVRAPSRSSCSMPHGPRRIQTARIPAAADGTTSLSTRSPTYATEPGAGEPRSSNVRAKNAGSGLCKPIASLMAIASTRTPSASSSPCRRAGWLAVTATR